MLVLHLISPPILQPLWAEGCSLSTPRQALPMGRVSVGPAVFPVQVTGPRGKTRGPQPFRMALPVHTDGPGTERPGQTQAQVGAKPGGQHRSLPTTYGIAGQAAAPAGLGRWARVVASARQEAPGGPGCAEQSQANRLPASGESQHVPATLTGLLLPAPLGAGGRHTPVPAQAGGAEFRPQVQCEPRGGPAAFRGQENQWGFLSKEGITWDIQGTGRVQDSRRPPE